MSGVLKKLLIFFAGMFILAGMFSMNISLVAEKFFDSDQLEMISIRTVDTFLDEKFDELKNEYANLTVSKEEIREQLHEDLRDSIEESKEKVESTKRKIAALEMASIAMLAMGIVMMFLGTFNILQLFKKIGKIGVAAMAVTSAMYFALGKAAYFLIRKLTENPSIQDKEARIANEMVGRILDEFFKAFFNYGLLISLILLAAFLILTIVFFAIGKK